MTIKELYEWAIANGVADYEIEIADCDGGIYTGDSHWFNDYDIDVKDNFKTVIF